MARMNEAAARQRAKEVLDAESSPQELIDFAEYVLATTNEPTMADVEWNRQEHYLAGATLTGGREVVMIRPSFSNSDHIVTDAGDKRRDCLTPTGKRYKMVEAAGENEADASERNAVLVTEQDYANMSEGAIVITEGHVSVREAFGWYIAGCEGGFSSEYMACLGEGEVVKRASE